VGVNLTIDYIDKETNMMLIRATNVADAFTQAWFEMRTAEGGDGFRQWRRIAPRGGQVTYEYVSPVATVYSRPWQHVLSSAARDANPFFHLMEGLWMLAGRNDLRWIEQFNSRMREFSQFGVTLDGAYGWRWREEFAVDQLDLLGRLLTEHPDTRRAVLQMWSADDLIKSVTSSDVPDVPCNTSAYFKIRDGKLHMTVSCRSNDIIWGCYGANVVHFGMLMEYMASVVGAEMGVYTQISDSWHFYEDNPSWRRMRECHPDVVDLYTTSTREYRMVSVPAKSWNADLYKFINLRDWIDITQYRDPFFRHVAVPMRHAWDFYKRGQLDNALEMMRGVERRDWREEGELWLRRRVDRREVA
jgi:hypothetical protein